MIGLGAVATLIGVAGLWLTRRGRLPRARWFWRAAIWSVGLPLAANTFGWIFTEVGRQPWTVFGVLLTPASVSPGVSLGEVALSLGVFTLLYGVLAVIEPRLMLRYAKAGPPTEAQIGATAAGDDADADRPLSFAY